MAPRRSKAPQAPLALVVHAVLATRPRTAEEADACSVRFNRARDFLMHAAATAVLTTAGPLTAEEVDDLRPAALDEMRAVCGACGLCAQFGRKPP